MGSTQKQSSSQQPDIKPLKIYTHLDYESNTSLSIQHQYVGHKHITTLWYVQTHHLPMQTAPGITPTLSGNIKGYAAHSNTTGAPSVNVKPRDKIFHDAAKLYKL